MKEVEYLSKDDDIQFGSSKGYKAMSEEKVTSSVRPSLINNGLVVFPIKQEHKREGTLTTVDVTYRIVNTEKPEEYIDVVSSGTGTDSQDKGVGKAMTYAFKYLLLRIFAIPTGEDADKISNAQLDEEERDRKNSAIEELRKELERTGYKEATVLKQIQVKKLEDATEEQLNHYIEQFGKIADKKED